MPIQPDELRYAMRRWATGVTIVSSSFEGKHHGMTASSFTSISLEPPYVMVSLERNTRTHEFVIETLQFGVTILKESQQDISNKFAIARTDVGLRFEGVENFTLESGVLFIKDSLAYLDCRVVKTIDVGTHSVFIGEVIAVKEGDDESPLIYFNQSYRKIS